MSRKFFFLAAAVLFMTLSCSKDGGSGNSPAGDPYFSVSKELKVQFAPGNLAYDKNDGYYFVAPSAQGDLFCWGTGDRPLYRSDDVDFNEFGTFVDWGKGVQADGGGWRTLSGPEWGYILDYRKNASKLYAGATVCERWGVLLLPDNWKAPSGVKIKTYSANSTSFEDNVFDESGWEKIAAAGAVFLPYYEATEKDRYGYDYYEPKGEYHSSSNYVSGGMEYNYSISTLEINKSAGSSIIMCNVQRSRANRAAVRLVKDIK